MNHNNVDNTNIQAIITPTHSTMSNNCLKCGKGHAFHREAFQHSDQNATHVVKQTTEHQYICQTVQNQNKG